MHVGVQHRGHLGLLDGADLALRVHDEDRHILLAAQTIDGSRARVAARGANDGQVLLVALGLALIPPHEEVFEQVAQELQGDVLEGEGRAVEQFKQVDVALLVEGHGRGAVLGAEGGVALADELLEVGGRDLGGRDVEREDGEGQLLERVVLPGRGPVGGQGGDLLGDEQAAIVGEALQDDILEGQLGVRVSANVYVCLGAGRRGGLKFLSGLPAAAV